MIKKRRKAVQYSKINNIKDINSNVISKGDFINVIDINQIYGPVTYILKEITGSTIESLKVVIYVNNNIFSLANVTKYL